MATLFHGTDRTEFVAHAGVCLTNSEERARDYGGNVFAIEVVDGTCASATRVDGYDRDTNTAPGDDGDGEGWIEYADESPYGRAHTTWRAMDDDALSAILSATLIAE